MSKYFCFHCQKDVMPYSFWKRRFCPHCKRLITDIGDGFYIVCDKCGANLPPDAKRCLKCGHGLLGDKDIDVYAPKSLLFDTKWLNLLSGIFLLFFSAVLGLCVLYFSVYLILFFIFAGLLLYIFDVLHLKF